MKNRSRKDTKRKTTPPKIEAPRIVAPPKPESAASAYTKPFGG